MRTLRIISQTHKTLYALTVSQTGLMDFTFCLANFIPDNFIPDS